MTTARPRPAPIGRWRPYLLMAPVLLLLFVGVVVPLLSFFTLSFLKRVGGTVTWSFTFDNVLQVVSNNLYPTLIGRALFYAALVTAIALLLAYPLAYITATRVPPARKNFVLLAVLVPVYTSDVVRIFAWRSVLGTNGLVNKLLEGAHLIGEPIEGLLFSPFAAVLSLVHMMFPFMFLAVWAGLENLKPSLIEAARDLGAAPWRTLSAVVLPLSLPGIAAGVFFVFVPVTGDYLYTSMLGGTASATITKAVVQQFGAGNNWPFGSALAGGMMIAMLLCLAAFAALVIRHPALQQAGHGSAR